MSNKAVKHIIKQFFCWILLIQMINLSINSADFRDFRSTKTFPKNVVSFNEIESLCELIAESVFGENIPDSEDKDTDSSFKSFDFFSSALMHNEIVRMPCAVKHFSFSQLGTSLVHTEPIAPPPKRA